MFINNRKTQFVKALALLIAMGGLLFQSTCALGYQTVYTQSIIIKNQHFDGSKRVAQDFTQQVPRSNSPFVAPAPKYKTVATSLKGFGVPFKINADNESFIEVQLYVSRDMGQTWNFHSRTTTDKTEFPFQAEEDGEYWFALKTLNRDRRLVPEGDPQIDLKIIVDTVKPELEFRVDTDAAGRVVCAWNSKDKNLEPRSLRILYQPAGVNGDAKGWTEVPIKLGGQVRAGVYADQLAWWPETTEQQLSVAVEIKDIAGNTVQLDRQVRISQAGWRNQPASTTQSRTTNSNVAVAKTDAWSGTDSISRQSVTKPPVQQSSQTEVASHPPGVVCKDGVCTIVQTASPTSKSIASVPKKSIDPNEFLRGLTPEQLGVDYSAPPVPDGYVPENNTAQKAAPGATGFKSFQSGFPVPNPHGNSKANGGPVVAAKSQVWQSETSRWNLDRQTSSSTTMLPDPKMAPDPFPQRPAPKPVTDVASNPSSMFHKGDQVIGQSSTQGQSNQYRGLNSQAGAQIPHPTLMPGVKGEFKSDFKTESNDWQFDKLQTANSQSNGFKANNSMAAQTEPFSKTGFKTGSTQSTENGFGALVEKQPARRERSLKPLTPNRNSKAPMQIIGSKRFRLNYGIDSIDPSGVAKVDLWMTRDEGRTWNAWGSDPDNQSPFPVQVQEEGRYGFRVVVHSKDGLTGQGPSSGDDADMWILIDTQSPLARISSVPYGRGDEAGRLIINYSVADKNITLRPIALAYSSSPNGPWEAIGTGLRNESRFVWKPTAGIPDRIFLRIDALDKAGNVGIHKLSQAIDVSGLVPRGTIHGVMPVGERSPRGQ